jgi:SAM-dependent methyltransferase
MKKALSLSAVALAGLLAFVTPFLAQDLDWNQYKGFDVPFVPTPPEVVDEMLRLAKLKAGDVLYDLGCGDGRIVIAAAKRYGVKAIGIDIDPVRISESNANAVKAGLEGKVRFIQQDLFEADFKDATVVTMYLLTSVNLRLRPKLLTELKPGTRLVSHSFDMGDWIPDTTTVVPLSYDSERSVHFWVVPANASGRWVWELPDGPKKRHYVFEAAQRFQALSGPVTADGAPLKVDELHLAGDIISFVLTAEAAGKMASSVYEGKVQGDTIVGTVRSRDNPKAPAVAWKAARDPKTVKPIAD